jgi:hypothetical protein
VNGHTAIIRSFGTTGVLLVLALVLLAIVSAIVAFDRWPESGGASSVERIAVDRSEVRRVETQLVRAEREAPVVRGVVAVRAPGASATAPGAGDVFLVADRGAGGQSDGGGFGPPPPPVPFNAPGDGGGVGGGTSRSAGNGGSTVPGPPEDDDPIRTAACGVGEALGEAGSALAPACRPGSRGLVRETLANVARTLGLAGDDGAGGVELQLTR